MTSRPFGAWTRLEIYFNTSLGKEWSNIMWYKQSAAVSPGNFVSDANALMTAVQTLFGSVQATPVQSPGGTVTFNDGTSSYGVEVYTGGSGAISGLLMPEDVSAVVQRLTGAGGPTNRGRLFVTGLPETYGAGSYLSGPGLAALQAFAAASLTPINGSVVTYSPYLFSPKAMTYNQITNMVAVNLLATNRKRRPRF